ncbi:hypothetical protein NDU88_005988 [Pleurodeles waltl]|uniref:Uncharacterized protein n=1 Tax=Pleurodeles waltl TaxID=8319 RepID=A0AAV7TVU9_PLEWA|nr:hypothetical protein NDU88_005988 [Pleurodeles waltl]
MRSGDPAAFTFAVLVAQTRKEHLQSPRISRGSGPAPAATQPRSSMSGCTMSRGPALLPSTDSAVSSEEGRPLRSRPMHEPGEGSTLLQPVSLRIGNDTDGRR